MTAIEISLQNISGYQSELKGKSPEETLKWTVELFGPENVALATSFGAEDQVATHQLTTIDKRAGIFTLDTGRLHQETYDVMQKTVDRYGVKIEVMFPDFRKVESMTFEKGPNLFYESIESRKLCCKVRKLEPLKRKLSTLKAWITGLRREQAVTRANTEIIEWDETNGLFKLNPLVDWTEKQVWNFIKSENIPYNALHDQNFPSIGCTPCTRAVEPGEEVRAGRWWWEQPESKECGLHWKDGKLVRAKET